MKPNDLSVKMKRMTGENLHNTKRTRFLGAEKTVSGREHPSAKRLKILASAVLFLMAMTAGFVHSKDVSNYISSFNDLSLWNLT